MKVKVIHRDAEEFDARYKKPDAAHRTYRNADPRLHPLENVSARAFATMKTT